MKRLNRWIVALLSVMLMSFCLGCGNGGVPDAAADDDFAEGEDPALEDAIE